MNELQLVCRSEATDSSLFDQQFASTPRALREEQFHIHTIDPELTVRLMHTPLPIPKEFWLAKAGDTVVGSIGANLSLTDAKVGYVGFFEVGIALPNKEAIANALLSTAGEWLKSKGAKKIIGPINLSTWFPYRLSVETYEDQYSWEPGNPPDYPAFFRKSGFEPGQSYCTGSADGFREVLAALKPYHEKALHEGYRFRNFDMDNLIERELPILHRLTIESFSGNYLFEPLPIELFREIYVPIMKKPELLEYSKYVVNPEGREVGYLFCFVDKKDAVLKSIATTPKYQGKGLGYAVTFAAFRSISNPKELNGCMVALVKTDAVSEKFINKFEQSGKKRWRHEYQLYEKLLS